MSLKIALIVPALKQDGPIKVVASLVNSLADNTDTSIEVFYLDKEIDSEIKIGVPINLMNVRKFAFEDYDVIHTHGIRPDLIAFWNRKKIKYHISTIHNFVFDDLRYTYNWPISIVFGTIWLILWQRADKLVCVSHSLKRYYEKWYSSSKLVVVHNGITLANNSFLPDDDIARFISESRSKGLTILGTACSVTKRKGLEQVLNIMTTEKQYALVIIGEGKESSVLVRHAGNLNVSDRCYFCGFRSNAVKYFKLFDIFIMPSRTEGFCLALTEAIFEQVPVVCSDINVFRELFNSSEVVFFKSENRVSLINALKETEISGLDKIKAASIRVEKDYSSELMASRYFDLYKLAVA
jgi:glycosyltransferase involved in cell wall biosynthesis